MAGTIRKRSWLTRKGEEKTAWVADYFDQHRRRHTKQFPTKRAADAWLLRARGEVRDGVHTPDSTSITVAVAGTLWLERCALNGLERGTQRAYDQLLRLCIDPLIGATRLARLTAPLVEEFRDRLLQKFAYERARRALVMLKTVLDHAQRRGLVAHNPARAVRITERPRLQERLIVGRTIPSPAEVQAMLGAAEGWARVMLIAAAFTGMREGELRGLMWQDVDFAGDTVTVRQRADQWGGLGPPKTRAGQRTILMTPLVLSELRQWKLRYLPTSHAYGPGDPAMVFPGRYGTTVVPPSTVLLAFREIQIRAGVIRDDGKPKYVFHALRHFFASVMIGLGYTSKWLQVTMGHENIVLTLGTYGHLFPDRDGERTRMMAFEAAVLGKSG